MVDYKPKRQYAASNVAAASHRRAQLRKELVVDLWNCIRRKASVMLAWLALLVFCFGGVSVLATELKISVEHTFHGAPLLLDSLRFENDAGETFSVTRLSYLLSGFALQRAGGEWVEIPGEVAWIDAEKRRISFALQRVAEGRYAALRFAVGLDAATNAAKAADFGPEHPLNPNVNGLHWSWQGGYIFLALEGNFRKRDGGLGGYAYHFARDANRTPVEVPIDFEVGGGAGLALEFDLARLLGAPRAVSFVRDGTATHAREGDALAAALRVNLASVFRLVAGVSAGPAAAGVVTPLKPLDLPARFTPYRFTFNRTFPLPALPMDNPLIEERVALGRALFSEPALSRDRTISCASCHRAENAFADPKVVSEGIEGRRGTRNAMPLFNLAWKTLYFRDGRAPSLRAQVLSPIADHREMDLPLDELADRLNGMEKYRGSFAAAFGSEGVTSEKVGLALEQFLLTLVAGKAKFDRAVREEEKLSSAEQRGFELFMTEYDPRTGQRGADCFHCHGGALFSDHQFHNNGLEPRGGDEGRKGVTGRKADRGKFATPSLRNVARTGPYMHDGRFATLEEVVAHYNSGLHRSGTLDPNLAKHPENGLGLSAEDQAALVAFLRTLSEE